MIKLLRTENKLMQKELAYVLNVKRYTISDWELGRSEPNSEQIKKLCIIFGVTADELLEIDTPTQRKNIKINNSLNNNSGNIDIKF